jgi:hypothetical protein
MEFVASEIGIATSKLELAAPFSMDVPEKSWKGDPLCV